MKLQRIAENYFLSLPIAVAMVFAPLLNWVGLTWAVFATLRQNKYQGLLAVGLVGFVNFYIFNNMEFKGLAGEWLSFIAFIGPLWAMAYCLRMFRSLTLSLELGFFILAICALLSFGVYGPVTYDELYQYISQRIFSGNTPSDVTGQTIQQVYIETMTAITIAAWPMMLLFLQFMLLMLARYVQSRWYNPGGFQAEFHQLRLSRFMVIPLVLSLTWAAIAPQAQVSVQLALLSIFVYSIAGIAMMHWYMKFKILGMPWYVLFYVLLFVVSAWALPFLAIIGLIDSYFDLRSRLKR